MCSGKTTLADGLGFQRVSLAAPIKIIEAISDAGLPNDQVIKNIPLRITQAQKEIFSEVLDEMKAIERETKPRKRYQHLGTIGVRNRIDQDFWVKWLKADMLDMPRNANYVIDDVRFMNEFTFFKSEGWKSVVLTVPPSAQRARVLDLYGSIDEVALTHPSEISVDDIVASGLVDLQINTLDDSIETMIAKTKELLDMK